MDSDSAPDRINLYKLKDESKADLNLVTIEGTVDTGFEFLALDECKEKFGSTVKVCRSRGRIFFNVPLATINEIKSLRSVDNLYLVAAAIKSFDFDKESKDVNLLKIKQLVETTDLKDSLEIWKSFVGFNGIVLPTVEEYLKAEENRKKIKMKETSDNVESNVEIVEVEQKQELSDEVDGSNNELENNVIKFRATCNRAGTHPFSSQDAMRDFGGHLQDQYHWLVDLTNYDIEVILNITEDQVYICFALTKESMHRRNIVQFGPTVLRATHCYNMLRMAMPQVGDIVVDPLCGGGSIPIEGALAFQKSFYIAGDIHEKAVARTELNCAHVCSLYGCSVPLDIFKWDVSKLPLRTSSVDVFATDLPFGKRSGKKSNNRPLYIKALQEMARVVRPTTGRAVLLTHDKKTFSQVLRLTSNFWSQPKPYNINLGGLEGGVFFLRRTARLF